MLDWLLPNPPDIADTLPSIKIKKLSEPKNILLKAIKEHLLERMKNLGFSFSESQLKFKRKSGNFNQELWFIGSKNNWRSERIEFQYQFVVTHSKYKKLLKELGEKVFSSSSIVQGNKEPLKSLDKSKQLGFGYDFVKMNHKEIMDDIYINLEISGLPYFEANNTEEKIAIDSTGNEKIDFNILIGNYGKAKELCEYSFNEFTKLSQFDQDRFNYLMDMWKRKYEYIKKYG